MSKRNTLVMILSPLAMMLAYIFLPDIRECNTPVIHMIVSFIIGMITGLTLDVSE